LLASDYAQLLLDYFIDTTGTAELIDPDGHAGAESASGHLGSFVRSRCGGLVDFACTSSFEGWLEQGCRCVELRVFSTSSIGIG